MLYMSWVVNYWRTTETSLWVCAVKWLKAYALRVLVYMAKHSLDIYELFIDTRVPQYWWTQPYFVTPQCLTSQRRPHVAMTTMCQLTSHCVTLQRRTMGDHGIVGNQGILAVTTCVGFFFLFNNICFDETKSIQFYTNRDLIVHWVINQQERGTYE